MEDSARLIADAAPWIALIIISLALYAVFLALNALFDSKFIKEKVAPVVQDKIMPAVKTAYSVKEVRFVTTFFVCLYILSKFIPHSIEIQHTGYVNAHLKNDKITIEHTGSCGSSIKIEQE